MAIAAMLAWLVSRQLIPSQSFIAPYAAVFVVDATVLRSLLGAVRQLTAVVLGLLIAFVAVRVVPEASVSMGVVVLIGVLIGQWQWLGDSGIWIAATALVVVANGIAGEPGDLVARFEETLIGAIVGATINALVLPRCTCATPSA